MIKHKFVNYVHFASIHSTNSWAKEHASTFDPKKITCITADEQTAGRGTFSKKWISPKGLNIYATLYFTLPKGYPFLQNLGQVFSVSCCKYLEKLLFHPRIKWPNDLFLNRKKFAGILAEATPFEEHIGLALGLGLNVNMPGEMLQSIDQPATSLLEVSGKEWVPESILHGIIDVFLEDLNLLSGLGFSVFSGFYNDRLAFKGETVNVRDGSRDKTGICKGISPEGSLIFSLPDGKEVQICSGKIL